jgi:hypothetical protein
VIAAGLAGLAVVALGVAWWAWLRRADEAERTEEQDRVAWERYRRDYLARRRSQQQARARLRARQAGDGGTPAA